MKLVELLRDDRTMEMLSKEATYWKKILQTKMGKFPVMKIVKLTVITLKKLNQVDLGTHLHLEKILDLKAPLLADRRYTPISRCPHEQKLVDLMIIVKMKIIQIAHIVVKIGTRSDPMIVEEATRTQDALMIVEEATQTQDALMTVEEATQTQDAHMIVEEATQMDHTTL